MDARKAALIQSVKLLFIIAAVTLVYSAKSYNFIQIKEAIFSMGVAVLILTLFAQKNMVIKKQAILFLILPAWFVISAAAGKYGYAARPPLAAAAVLAVFFLVAAGTEWDPKRLRGVIIIASAPAVMAGLLEMVSPSSMKEFMVFGIRVPSLLGNPNFFGAYLAGTAPLALAGVMGEKGNKRILYALFLLAAIFCMIATGSKAALIGMIFIVSWPYFIFMKKSMDVKKNLVILACLTSVVLIATVAVMGYRLSKTADRVEWAKNESVFFRAYTWLGTLGIIKDNPVSGAGPGAFAVVYPEYRKPEIMLWTHEHSYETTQPENIILQLAAETGLPGVLIALYLLFLVVKNAKQEHNEYLSGLLAILIINLAGVDLNYITSSMLVALYAGVIMSRGAGGSYELKSWHKNARAAAALVLVVLVIAFQFNMHVSMVYLKQGAYYSQARQWNMAIESYQKSLERDKNSLPAMYFLANSRYDSGAPEKALREYEKLEKLAPNYVLLHYNKGRIYDAMTDQGKAAEEYNKMLKTDPYFKPALVDLAQIYAEKNQMYAEAENCLKKALEAYPDDASVYNNLGNIYFMSKKPEQAVAAFKKAVDLKPDKDYYYNLGCVYFTMDDTKNAELYLKKALEMSPEDVKVKDMLRRVEKYSK